MLSSQLYGPSNKYRQSLIYALLLAITVVMTYWPVCFGLFSLKNDALVYFLPWRYHISESVQNGYFPFWNPYLFTGLPIYSDMQSGAWNPVVLIISVFTKYNMQVLQWELLLYIFLAGIGMYKLIKEFNYSYKTALAGAISFMCCGFITDSGSFISWITCAAYLPFLFLYLYRLIKKPSLIFSVKLGLVFSLLFTAGNPGFFIFSAYIFIIIVTGWFIHSLLHKKPVPGVLKHIGAGFLLFIILSLPAIISYFEFLPYYQRGSGASLDQALTDPFSPFCSISYLLPNAGAKPHPWMDTDIAMRNGYTGIFMLLFFFISLSKRFTLLQKFVLGITLFCFLFSLGDYTPLRKWFYYLLPLMDTFRHPAMIRLFTSLGIIIIAAPAIDDFWSGKNYKKVKLGAVITGIILIILGLYYFFDGGKITKIFTKGKSVKEMLDDLKFGDIAVTEALIQVLFIAVLLLWMKNKKLIQWLLAANVIVFAMIALPFTFVSRTKTSEINAYLNSFPENYPHPDLSAAIESNIRTFTTKNNYGYSKFYDKKITIQDYVISPTVNTDYHHFLSDTSLRKELNSFSFAYISSPGKIIDSSARIYLAAFSPLNFSFKAFSSKNGSFHLFQQYHPNWKVKVNGNPVTVNKSQIAFMQADIPAGNSVIDFQFTPGLFLVIAMYLSATILLLSVIYLLFTYRNVLRSS